MRAMPKMSHLSRTKPGKDFFKNCVGGNFFEIFFGVFSGSAHHDATIELLMCNSVVWASQKFSIICK